MAVRPLLAILGLVACGDRCADCTALVEVHLGEGSRAHFDNEPAPALELACETELACIRDRPDAVSGSFGAGRVEVVIDGRRETIGDVPEGEVGDPVGVAASGGDFPAFDLRHLVRVPPIDDLVPPQIPADTDIVDLRWEPGHADAVVLTIETMEFNGVDCVTRDTCRFADDGQATVTGLRREVPFFVRDVALGRIVVGEAEVDGAIVELRVTAQVHAETQF